MGQCIPGKKADGPSGYFFDTSMTEVAFIPKRVPN